MMRVIRGLAIVAAATLLASCGSKQPSASADASEPAMVDAGSKRTMDSSVAEPSMVSEGPTTGGAGTASAPNDAATLQRDAAGTDAASDDDGGGTPDAAVTCPGWTCDPTFYAAKDGCDCECGCWDPDCNDASEFTFGCEYPDTCATPGTCQCAGGADWCVDRQRLHSCLAQTPLIQDCETECVAAGSDGAAGCDADPTTGAPTCICFDADTPCAGWACSPDFYGKGDGCDCNCGCWDPDCSDSAQMLFGCGAEETCAPRGACECNEGATACLDADHVGLCADASWTSFDCAQLCKESGFGTPTECKFSDSDQRDACFCEPAPVLCSGWTCNPSFFDASDGCDCNCGCPDPDCLDAGQQLYNCAPLETCSVSGTCVPPGTCTEGETHCVDFTTMSICSGGAPQVLDCSYVCEDLMATGPSVGCAQDSGLDTEGCICMSTTPPATRSTLYIHGRTGGRSTDKRPEGWADSTPIGWEYWNQQDGWTTQQKRTTPRPGVNPVPVNWDGEQRLAITNGSVRDALDDHCTGNKWCYIACHSTGCPQFEYAQALYGEDTDTGLNKWNIIWVGAAGSVAGGSELASFALSNPLSYLVSVILVGVYPLDNDLVPSTMRDSSFYNHALARGVDFYEFVGNGNFPWYQRFVHTQLPGSDDGAVAFHSAGGLNNVAYEANAKRCIDEDTTASCPLLPGGTDSDYWTGHFVYFRDDRSLYEHRLGASTEGISSRLFLMMDAYAN